MGYNSIPLSRVTDEDHYGSEGGEEELQHGEMVRGSSMCGTPGLRVRIEILPRYGKVAALHLGVGSPKAKGRKPRL